MLIVEDGTIVLSANSYSTVEYADSYHALRGNAAWASLTLLQKQASLIRASDYIDVTYAADFAGERISTAQQMAWPRAGAESSVTGVIPSTTIPQNVMRAVCEMAAKIGAGADPIPDTARAVKKEKVGELEVEYEAHGSQQPSYPQIDALINPVLASHAVQGVMMRMSRC